MKTKFISRIIPETTLQKILKACRRVGLHVEKLDDGYSVKTNTDFEVLKAMNGTKAYLVRINLPEDRKALRRYAEYVRGLATI